MKASHRLFAFGAALAVCMLPIGKAAAEIKTQTVEYQQPQGAAAGFLAYDDASTAKRPAVLLAHARRGMDPFIEERAQMIAKLGYVGFAADIFGKDVRPQNQEQSSGASLKHNRDRPLTRAKILTAYELIRQDPRVDPSRIAVIGFCFGGIPTLELARSGAPIRAAVSFHGTLSTPTPDDAKNIKGRVLVLHGANDPTVDLVQVNGFIKEMRDAKVDFDLELYGGVLHGYTNPANKPGQSSSSAYDERADRRSWIAMQQLFQDVFKQ